MWLTAASSRYISQAPKIVYSTGQYLRAACHQQGPWYILLSELTLLCILHSCGLTSSSVLLMMLEVSCRSAGMMRAEA